MDRLVTIRSSRYGLDIELDPELIVSGDFSYESGYNAIMTLHKKGVKFN